MRHKAQYYLQNLPYTVVDYTLLFAKKRRVFARLLSSHGSVCITRNDGADVLHALFNMHTFTKQQRQGGPRYQSRTLLGNWSEENDQYAANMKAFLEQKHAGTLKTDIHNQRVSTGLAPVQLSTTRQDQHVHFGDVLQLVHAHTGAVLAVDAADKDARPGVEACAASASVDPRSQAPVARSCFLLQKLPGSQLSPLDPHWEDNLLRYGQKIRLLAHPAVQGGPCDVSGGDGVDGSLVLYSCPVGPTCVARSRHQLVGFTWQADTFDSVWQIQPLDPGEVLLLEGQPVTAGAPVLLVHCATLAPLAIDAGVPHPNDFGIEVSVSCHAHTSHGKQLSLEHTARGEDLRVLPKAKLGSNHWVFVTAALLTQQQEQQQQQQQ